MEISCPTCQQRYRIGDANIPPDKRVVATCKNWRPPLMKTPPHWPCNALL
ncbi:MAG: zinc-ribbon domain-containing protein [Deltaproteobacteria bacterium]|nr:zinc-ribbon domain-containing protein [Deltaproteobacteria bacterium]